MLCRLSETIYSTSTGNYPKPPETLKDPVSPKISRVPCSSDPPGPCVVPESTLVQSRAHSLLPGRLEFPIVVNVHNNRLEREGPGQTKILDQLQSIQADTNLIPTLQQTLDTLQAQLKAAHLQIEKFKTKARLVQGSILLYF